MMRRILVFVLKLCSFLAALVIAAWFVGRIFSDRYGWSQWLLWIPTPVALLMAVIGTLAAFRSTAKPPRRRNRIIRWGLIAISIFIDFATIEHRLLRPAPSIARSANRIHLVHWNITLQPYTHVEQLVSELVSLDGDITVTTNPGFAPWEKPVVDALGNGIAPVSVGPLAVISRFPIRTIRPLVAANQMFVVLVEIDATARIGRPLIVYMVDMPSNPKIPRYELARQVRRMLDDPANFGGALPPAPDIVIGDFNITRGSASLRMMFPTLRDAYDEAGHGYGASFHRLFPLYHIDHVLMGPDMRALRYDLVDPHLTRHDAQIAEVGRR